MNSSARARKVRWAVPAGIAATAGVVVAGSAIAVAQAAPKLPARSAADLLAAAAGSNVPAFSGTAVETASLGIPQLPGAADPSSAASLLAGSHTVNIWYGGPGRERVSLPVQMGETDLIHNGRTLWLWQASTDSVTRVEAPAGMKAPETAPGPAKLPATPKQLAQQALAAAGPSTRVSEATTTVVAGQDAYQLVISPKSSGSLIGRITLALDAAHPSVPLRVQVFARGAATPAIQVGFSSISFAAPAASEFTFTPPHGAHVHTVTPGSQAAPFGCGSSFSTAVPAIRGLPPQIRAVRVRAIQRAIQGSAVAAPPMLVNPGGPVQGLKTVVMTPAGPVARSAIISMPKGMKLAPGQPGSAAGMVPPGLPAAVKAAIKAGKLPAAVAAPLPRIAACGPPLPLPLGLAAGAPHVIGSGWTAVAVLPGPALGSLAGMGMGGLAGAAGQSAQAVAGPGGGAGGVPAGAALAALLASGHTVHGNWGSGRLIRTSLLSVLITSNGHILAGVVTPSVLFSDAAKVR